MSRSFTRACHFLLGFFLSVGPAVSTAQAQSSEESRRKGSTEQEFREFEHEHEVYDRASHDLMRIADPLSGLIPDHANQARQDFIVRMRRNASPSVQTTSLAFRDIGPGNVGGRTRAFAVDKTNQRVMLAGGVTGGMWRSIDGGQTWARVSSISDVMNVSCLLQHPANPSVWYAGTGEVLSTTERRTTTQLRTICTGSGLYTSVDNGVTWNRITPEISSEYNRLVTSLQGIWALAPGSQANDVYLACYGGVFRFLDGSLTRVLGDTVLRSFNTEVVKNGDGSVMYAACSATDDGNAPSSYGVWRMGSMGVWQRISPPGFPSAVRRFRMATSPSNPDVLYVFTQTPSSYTNRYTSFGSSLTLWRYTDDGKGGGRWENRRAWLDSTGMNTLAGYAMSLAVHPENDSIVFIAGTDAYMSASGFARANDAVHLGGYPYIVEPGRLHPDIHHLFFSVQKPYVLYSAGDGGLAYTTEWNKAEGYWRTLNNGYNVTQCYHAGQDHFEQRDSLVSVSLQDNSNYITTSPGSGRGWKHCGGGDGTCTAVMPDASLIFASSQYASVYAFTLNNGVVDYTGFDAPPAADSVAAQFVNTFFLLRRYSRNDTVLVMPVGHRLFYFPNIRAAYSQSNTRRGWREVASTGSLVRSTSRISALGQSRVDDALVLVGTLDGRVFEASLASDVGMTRELPALPVKGFVASLDGDENGNVVVALSNYTVRSVFLLRKGAASWIDVSDELENDAAGWGPSVRAIRFATHPVTNTTFLLAGTSVGLFVREFNGDSASTPWKWEAVSTIGNSMIESIDVRESDGRIIIGTQGAGVFESILRDDTNGVDTADARFLQLEDPYPNPAREASFVRYTTPLDGHVLLELFDVGGGRLLTLVDGIESAGPHIVEIDRNMLLRHAQNTLYVKLTAGGRSQTRVISFVR